MLDLLGYNPVEPSNWELSSACLSNSRQRQLCKRLARNFPSMHPSPPFFSPGKKLISRLVNTSSSFILTPHRSATSTPGSLTLLIASACPCVKAQREYPKVTLFSIVFFKNVHKFSLLGMSFSPIALKNPGKFPTVRIWRMVLVRRSAVPAGSAPCLSNISSWRVVSGTPGGRAMR